MSDFNKFTAHLQIDGETHITDVYDLVAQHTDILELKKENEKLKKDLAEIKHFVEILSKGLIVKEIFDDGSETKYYEYPEKL